MQKAMREAKQQTSWVANNKEFEDALNSFIDRTLASTDFHRRARAAFVERIHPAGRDQLPRPDPAEAHRPRRPRSLPGRRALGPLASSIPTTAAPSTTSSAPGSSSELHSLSADRSPRPHRRRSAQALDPSITALQLRREHPEWFGADAGYTPVPAEAQRSRPRHRLPPRRRRPHPRPPPPATLDGDWDDTTIELPSGTWQNRLTGESSHRRQPSGSRISSNSFPVALLARQVTRSKESCMHEFTVWAPQAKKIGVTSRRHRPIP